MFEDTYKTIAGPSEGIYREKGSKFIALAFPVESEAEVKEKLAEIQKQYFDARHHCYSYILGPNKDAYRLNDNGEPSGTAGRPIHGQLLSKDLKGAHLPADQCPHGTTAPQRASSARQCSSAQSGSPARPPGGRPRRAR